MHRTLFRIACLWILASGVPTAAQPEPPRPAAPNAADLVAYFYGQDIFIAPGRGFRSVRLGSSFQAAVQAWGPPQQVEEHPLFGMSRRATWAAGPDGRVIVSGFDLIREIEIQGGANVALQTVEGVRFGMPSYQVTTIYGPPASSSAGEITYPARGIAFGLSNGLVAAMKVFVPTSGK
jgi:hypothetical protein